MSEEPKERYQILRFEDDEPPRWELRDTSYAVYDAKGLLAVFYTTDLAYDVCEMLNNTIQWHEQGCEVVNVVNTTIPHESGKPNEWHIHDKNGEFVRAFQDRQKAYAFLNDLLKDDTALQIVNVCETIKSMLLDKNRKYGNSALEPVRVFSKSDALEQIRVRMDDKLSRIRNAQADDDEDAYMDLVGYLVLYLVARGRVKNGENQL